MAHISRVPRATLVALGLVLLTVSSATAQTVRVVDDDGLATVGSCDDPSAVYAAPSTAIAAAQNGDTVLVCPGTYVGLVNFAGKAITVRSVSGPGVTVLDGNAAGSVVTFANGETAEAVLEGFTIRNGRATFRGGGIRISGASPTIRGNVITANAACSALGVLVEGGGPLIEENTIEANVQTLCGGGTQGGGIAVIHAFTFTTVIRRNTIRNNGGIAFGGGISLFSAGTPTIEANVIADNQASSQGGGIWIVNGSYARIVGNLIVRNTAASAGGGIYWAVPSDVPYLVFINNTIAHNDNPGSSGMYAGGEYVSDALWNNLIVASPGQTAVFCANYTDETLPVFRSNNVYSAGGAAYGGECPDQTGTGGNISADPLFVDPANRDYHLQNSSPAIDAGDNTAPWLTAADLDGDPRILDGDRNGSPMIDIGADEAGADPPADPANDFTGDGGLDLLFRHQMSGDIVLWRMNGPTRMSSPMPSPSRAGLQWRLAGTGDMNGDGKPDILWQERNSGELVVWFMNGTTRVDHAYLSISRPADPAWQVAAVADYDGDGKEDLVWQHASSAELAVWFLDGTTVVARLAMNPGGVVDRDWRVVNTGDFDRNGKADLLWKHRVHGYLIVWLMDGATRVSTDWLTPGQLADPSWEPSAVGDLNGDGHADIIFQHPGDGRLAVWFLNGTTRTSSELLRPGSVLDTNWRIAGPR